MHPVEPPELDAPKLGLEVPLENGLVKLHGRRPATRAHGILEPTVEVFCDGYFLRIGQALSNVPPQLGQLLHDVGLARGFDGSRFAIDDDPANPEHAIAACPLKDGARPAAARRFVFIKDYDGEAGKRGRRDLFEAIIAASNAAKAPRMVPPPCPVKAPYVTLTAPYAHSAQPKITSDRIKPVGSPKTFRAVSR